MDTWCKVTVEEEYKKNPSLTEDMVTEMRTWLTNQPHLPQSLSDLNLIFHIHSADYDLDNAKKGVEAAYNMRTAIKFYKNRNPIAKEIEETVDCLHIAVIFEADNEGNTALVMKFNDRDASKFHYENLMRDCTMLTDLIGLERGTVPGLIFIVDTDGCGLGQLIRIPLGLFARHIRYLPEGLGIKIKAMHMINTKNGIIGTIMSVIKPAFSEELYRQFQIHPGYETLYEYGFKRDKLPEDYGGTAGPVSELTYNIHETLKEYTEFFKEEENLRIDESKRPKKKKKYFGIF